jgi:hypothetical protein
VKEWEWNLGKQPVGDDVLVDVMWCDGDIWRCRLAGDLEWSHSDFPLHGNIKKWRRNKK